MKIIDTMKKNWDEQSKRDAEAKKLKEIEKSKKSLVLSDNDMDEIVKLIKEQNISWGQLEPELLKLFLKLALKQYKPKEEDFDMSKKDEIKQKIADIFNSSDERITFTVAGETFRPNTITPNEIKQLNDAYAQGKNLGSGFTKGLKSLFKMKIKKAYKD